MSKEYEVRVPFAGVISMIIEAESEEDAIEKALHSDVRCDLSGDAVEAEGAEIEEWDMYEKTGQGNVCYLPLWEAEAVGSIMY